MGNLSWFLEGRARDSGRKVENGNLIHIYASYRRGAASGGWEGGCLGC